MNSFDVEPADEAAIAQLSDLADEAAESGITNVRRLMEWWADGSQTYDAAGELMLVARADHRLIAVGGMARCPDVPGALRVRRFYVARAWRRRGVASSLARRLVEHGSQHAGTITCNAQASAAAPIFWEALGFTPTDTPGITHLFRP